MSENLDSKNFLNELEFGRKPLSTQIQIAEYCASESISLEDLAREVIQELVKMVLSWPDILPAQTNENQYKMFSIGISLFLEIEESLGEDYWEETWKRSPLETFELWCARSASADLVLSELQASEEWDELRSELAQNPAISPKALEIYSKDELSEIRYSVAKHPASTIEILESLAIDQDIDVRTAVFNNPKATEEIRASTAILGIRER